MCAWAEAQSKATKRHNCWALLALGAGAGLRAGEIARVRGRDVVTDDCGVLITVTGARSRSVPVMRQWEDRLSAVAAEVSATEWVFRPQRHTEYYKSVVNGFVHMQTTGLHKPVSQRLRSTWVVTHLAAGTPLLPLMEAAGFETVHGIYRYTTFLLSPDSATSRSILRDPAGG